jgi:transglutaminase-like putative cysteine protease/lipoprotein NlpI
MKQISLVCAKSTGIFRFLMNWVGLLGPTKNLQALRWILGFVMPWGLWICVPAAWAQNAASSAEVQVKDAQVDSKQFVRGIAPPSWVKDARAKPVESKAAVVVNLADSQLYLPKLSSGEPEWYVRRVTQINDASALNQVGNLVIEFVPEYQRVHLHRVQVIRNGQSSDRLAKANVRFLQRERGLEQGMYSGVVTASLLLTDIQVGDQVEYSYTTIGENPVFGNKFSVFTSFESDSPVGWRQVRVLFDDSRPLKWQWTGDLSDFKLAPKVGRQAVVGQGEFTEWIFEANDLAVPVIENYYPPGYLPYRFLQLTEFDSWGGVGQWANKLFTGSQVSTPKVQQIAARFSHLPDDQAKARAALNYVQSEIRYFSVSLGESSHRPAVPDVTIDRRYGDCKDKTQLLIAILRELGIKAQPALISMAHQRRIDRWQPSPLSFDHVVARVEIGKRVFFLDATKLPQVGQLSRMGQGLIRHQAFVVLPEGGRFEEITSEVGTSIPTSDIREKATIVAFDRPATLESAQTLRGNAAEWLRLSLIRGEKSQIIQWLEADVSSRYSAAKLVGDYVVRDNLELNEISLSSRYEIPGMALADRKSWALKVSSPNMKGMIALPNNKNRLGPFGAIAFPMYATYNLEVQFPDNVAASFDPSSQELKTSQYIFNAQRSFRGSRASVGLSVRTLTDTVSPQDFVKFVDDLDAHLRALPSMIYVDASIIKSTGLFARTPTMTEQLTKRFTDELALLDRALAGGNLGGADAIEAQRDRASVLMSIERWDEALQSIELVLKQNAADPAALTTRGNVFSGRGQFTKAFEDYSRAIRLGADAEVYYRRGIANFYLGNLAAAADDFSRGVGARKGLEALYPKIWQVWSLRAQSKPIPSSLNESLKALDLAQWPAMAYQMAVTASDPDVMIRSLDALKGEEKQLALSEAYFYAGQEYLLRGNKTKAIEMFEACVKVGAIHYIEHIAAKFELSRLKN